MNFKDKIIGFDLDGTLAGYNGIVSDYSAKVISYLINKGYNITLITGRQWVSSKSSYEACNMKIACSLANGGVCYDPITNNKFFESKMPKEFVDYLVDNVEFVSLISDLMYEIDLDTYSLKNFPWNPRVIQCNFKDDMKELPSSLNTMAINKDDQPRIKEIVEKSNKYSYRWWGNQGEIYNMFWGKKDGALKMLEYLNKKPEDLIFFGDAENDIELLKVAGISVCMKNGMDKAKEISTYVTDYSNVEDGAVKFLLKLLGESYEEN